MAAPPIPQRIPPLAWRKPAFIWTPLALALAIGWPAGLFYDDPGPQRLAIAALFAVFALALVSLGTSWALRRPPRSRRVAVLHVVAAGVAIAATAPFVLTHLLALAAPSASTEQFSLAASLATTPLTLMLGLPVLLASGIVFVWIALRPGPRDNRSDVDRHNIQPFR